MAAFRREPVDYVPCCPFLNHLTPEQRKGYKFQFPFGDSQQEKIEYVCNILGMDPLVTIPINLCYPDSDVSTRIWFENNEIHKKRFPRQGPLACSSAQSIGSTVQFQYSRQQAHQRNSRGDPSKNPFWYLESCHPQNRMADYRKDLPHQTRRRRLGLKQR